jgi:uncharacterized membrane protein
MNSYNCVKIKATGSELQLLVMCLLTSCSLYSDIHGFNSKIFIYKLLPVIHLRKTYLKRKSGSLYL